MQQPSRRKTVPRPGSRVKEQLNGNQESPKNTKLTL